MLEWLLHKVFQTMLGTIRSLTFPHILIITAETRGPSPETVLTLARFTSAVTLLTPTLIILCLSQIHFRLASLDGLQGELSLSYTIEILNFPGKLYYIFLTFENLSRFFCIQLTDGITLFWQIRLHASQVYYQALISG